MHQLIASITNRKLAIVASIIILASSTLFAVSVQAAGPWYVSTAGNDANDCLSVATACLTINAAIVKASAGDTINVAAGTYAENVVLNKDLTLSGAQAGVDARGRAATEAIITPTTVGITLVTGSAGATIDGFTISGGTRGIESTSGPIDNLAIQNNRILAFTNSGIFLNDNGSDITIDKNVIDGTAKTGSGDLVHLDTDLFRGFWFTNNNVVNGSTATGLFVDGNHNVGSSTTPRSPKMTGNLFQANQTGVNLGSRAWGFGDISGNTFRNNTFDGLQGGIQDSTITSNTFDGNGRSGLALTSFGNTAADRGGQRNTITLNTFVGNGAVSTTTGAGITLSSTQAASTISTNTINRNSIAGNTFGLRYNGAETINAECNWWGNSSGPGPIGPGSGDLIGSSTGIDYTPWLTTSDLANGPCNGPAPVAPVTVTIVKYVDGMPATATASSTGSASFPMSATWNASNIGSGTGTYALGPTGFNNPNPYQATTAGMTPGASYATNEVTGGPVVGADCSAGSTFQLAGYTTGSSLAAAASSTIATTSPSFTNLTNDEYVIVWNRHCLAAPTPLYPADGSATTTAGQTHVDWTDVSNAVGGITYIYQASNASSTNPDGSFTSPVYTSGPLAASQIPTPGTPPGTYFWHVRAMDANGNTSAWSTVWSFTVTGSTPPPASTVTVHVLKYLDGQKAVASTTAGYLFPMEATWRTANLNGGATTTGNYVLGNFHGGAADQYGAKTALMQAPANYSTRELTGGSNQPLAPGSQCQTGMYRLVGYSTSATGFAAAASSTVSTTTPSFWGLTGDRYVIVWNEKCGTPPPQPSPIAACNAQTPPTGYTLVTGTPGHDNVTLAPNTMFVGLGGNDRVTGPNGNYIICLGSGNDRVNLGNGNADIDAGDGNNSITTGNGNGSIYTGVDNDRIRTGTGNHTISAGNGFNNIQTGDGTQNVTTGSQPDTITTGAGNDTINAGDGNNRVKAGGGNDTITAGSGNDNINGGPGTDTCNAGGGINSLSNCP